MRSKKALYNSISFLVLELISIICGFILPRLVLSSFGSTYNGLTTSITQFLSIVTLLRAGVGGVTRAALYKPLAENNTERISQIINATELFMRKIAYIFLIGLLIFACTYPILVRDSFEWLFTFSLVLIMGLSTFVQYYFAITYQMLIVADQRQYISALIQCVTLVLNLAIATVLIKSGFGIHTVKIGSALVFCMNPLCTCFYVRKKYQINRKAKPDDSALTQRWDAFMHQLAGYVQENTDVIVLTVFSTVREVSVYSVYYLISNGVKKLLATLTTGIEAAFGNMIALGDFKGLQRNMVRTEYILFSASTVVYSCLLILILPFVSIYTKGINDVNYIRPLFAILLTAAQFMNCIRTPYQNVVEAAGHFKQTRNGAIIEAAINIFISIIAVIKLGLVGVAIGTLISMLFRTCQLSFYASKHILNRSHWFFIKRCVLGIGEIILTYFIVHRLVPFTVTGYVSWTIYAIIVSSIAMLVVVVMSVLFDREVFKDTVKKVVSIIIH